MKHNKQQIFNGYVAHLKTGSLKRFATYTSISKSMSSNYNLYLQNLLLRIFREICYYFIHYSCEEVIQSQKLFRLCLTIYVDAI